MTECFAEAIALDRNKWSTKNSYDTETDMCTLLIRGGHSCVLSGNRRGRALYHPIYLHLLIRELFQPREEGIKYDKMGMIGMDLSLGCQWLSVGIALST